MLLNLILYDMKRTDYDGIFAEFLHLMEDEKIYLDCSVSFAGICSRLGVEEEEMDGFLYGSFGVSGEDVMAVYRRGVPLYML